MEVILLLHRLSPHPPERKLQDSKNLLYLLTQVLTEHENPIRKHPPRAPRPTPHNPTHSRCLINTRRHVTGRLGTQELMGGRWKSTGGRREERGGNAGRNWGTKGDFLAPTLPSPAQRPQRPLPSHPPPKATQGPPARLTEMPQVYVPTASHLRPEGSESSRELGR